MQHSSEKTDFLKPFRGDAIAHQHLPSYRSAFESQAHHLCSYKFIFEFYHLETTKINIKESGIGPIKKLI